MDCMDRGQRVCARSCSIAINNLVLYNIHIHVYQTFVAKKSTFVAKTQVLNFLPQKINFRYILDKAYTHMYTQLLWQKKSTFVAENQVYMFFATKVDLLQ